MGLRACSVVHVEIPGHGGATEPQASLGFIASLHM